MDTVKKRNIMCFKGSHGYQKPYLILNQSTKSFTDLAGSLLHFYNVCVMLISLLTQSSEKLQYVSG